MPNGGADCCGTCWFNSNFNEEKGHIEDNPDAEVRCILRDLSIEDPFWTYCSNHPAQMPDRIETPIGPVYIDAGEFPYNRKVWVESPDTEEIRETLLEILESTHEQPRPAYMVPSRVDETIIYQLMQFREERAVPILKRICEFDPFIRDYYGFRDRRITIAYALKALAAIIGDEALPDLERGLRFGLDTTETLDDYNAEEDRLATVRYYCVQGLEYCSPSAVTSLLQQASNDPNERVSGLARELLDRLQA